jgi:hypothetical protein
MKFVIQNVDLEEPFSDKRHTLASWFVIPTGAILLCVVLAASPEKICASNSQDIPIPTPAQICKPDNQKMWVSISGFAHLLLFYGRGPTDLPAFTSGNMMIKALTDEQAAIHAFGKSPFVITRNGLRYFTFHDPIFDSPVGEDHRDQVLATFAALNLPLNTPIHLIRGTHFKFKSGSYSIADLLSESVANFSVDQREPAWTAMAYAKYLPPKRDWENRFGERTSFSQLVKHLFRVDLNSQSCAGTHIFEALIQISDADHQYSLLDNQTRNQLDIYLTTTINQIVRSQQPDGGWNKQW